MLVNIPQMLFESVCLVRGWGYEAVGFLIYSWEAPGWLLGGRLGAENTPQDHSFYSIKSQPDWPHLTSIREGYCFGTLAEN